MLHSVCDCQHYPVWVPFQVKEELLVEALTKRKTVTVNDKLILPYSHSEVGVSVTSHYYNSVQLHPRPWPCR